MKKNNSFLKINLSIFLFVFLTIFILINDYICFFTKTGANFVTYLVSFLLLSLISCFLIFKKKVKIEKDKFNKADIIFLVFIIFILSLRVAIPDSAFDTLNYHLYLQENPFFNNTTFNFFPSRWINTFTLPLADRMHYFFRLILGYRLGLILNTLCLIVVFYQLKRILSKFMNNETLISLSALVIIVTEQILTNMITYYVDLLILPIFLEIILIIFDKEKNPLNNYWILLLAGIAISFKISNIYFIILFAILYIIKYRKSINVKTFLIGIPLFIFPFVLYLLNNYIQTGNPVFPFYNSIFKSPYLEIGNWLEDSYGPKNFIERLIWPLYTLINPRRSFDTNTYYGRVAFGYVIAFLILIINLYKSRKSKKIDKKEYFGFSMSILLITMCLIWSNFMMGYIRYALILELLSGVVSIYFIYKYFNKGKVLNFLSIAVICSLMYVGLFSCADLMKTGNEISWRYPYSVDEQAYKRNMIKLFSKNYDYDKLLKNVSCIAITDYNAGYASLLTHKIPIIDIHSGYSNEYGKKQMNNLLKKCDNIYTISTSATLDRTKTYVEEIGYTSTNNKNVSKVDFLNIDYDLVLFEIKKDN